MNQGRKLRLPAPFGAHKKEKKRNAPERIFTIMSEFFDGNNFFQTVPPNNVTVFGSARFDDKHPVYEECVKFAELVAKDNVAVITGGGGGVMEAANKGAFIAGGQSIGINVRLPFEQKLNKFVRQSRAFYYFFTRKSVLAKAYKAYVFFPGGFGTMDEFFEMLRLIQQGIKKPLPIICVGIEYWQPLLDFLQLKKIKAFIDHSSLPLFTVVKDAQSAYDLLKEYKGDNLAD